MANFITSAIESCCFDVNRQSFYFTTEPEDATVPPGSNVELKCNARHAKARPQYKWVLNGSELVLGSRAPLPRISDGTSSGDGNLLIRNISHLAYGMYQCVAKVFGQAIISRRASVRMLYLYQRSDLEPLNKTCNETSFCTISLREVYGFPSPAFVWEFRKNYSEDFREIGSNSDWSSRFAVSSDGMLCNRNVSNFDEGEYRCKIGNSSRTLFSNVYRVKVTKLNVSTRFPDDKQKDEIHVMVEPRNITVGISWTASFDCITSGTNTVVKWWKGDKQNLINASTKYEMHVSYRLDIKQTVKEDEGWYGCLVVNNRNSFVKEAYLKVRELVELIIHWGSSVVVPRGGELVLSITAHNGEIEWYKNGRPIDRGQSIPSITRVVTRIGGEIVKDEQTLRLKNVTTNDRGIYQVLGRGFQTEDSAYTKVMIYDCGGVFHGEYGSVTSPRFPEFYPENVKCVWVIKNDEEDKMGKLHLSFSTFDIGARRSCPRDYLEIRDGESQNSGVLGRYSNRNKPPNTITSRLSALRLTFKSGACTENIQYKGFNATFWISAESTTVPTTKLILSSTTGYETNGPRITSGEMKTVAKTTVEYKTEGSKDANSRSNNNAVYGATAAGVCLLIIFGIGWFLYRRKESKGRKERREVKIAEAQEGSPGVSLTKLGRKDPEVEAYTTPGEDNIVFYSVLENNAENLGQTAELSTDVHKPPVYDVLEATYVSAGEISGSQDPYTYLSEENKTSDNTYATLDQARSTDNCATPLPTSSENSKTNSSEAIYTTLSAERDENNVYSSLCKTSKDGETGENSLASLPGMNNSVQDYVFLLN